MPVKSEVYWKKKVHLDVGMGFVVQQHDVNSFSLHRLSRTRPRPYWLMSPEWRLNDGFLTGHLNHWLLKFDVQMFRICFCIILTPDKKIKTSQWKSSSKDWLLSFIRRSFTSILTFYFIWQSYFTSHQQRHKVFVSLFCLPCFKGFFGVDRNMLLSGDLAAVFYYPSESWPIASGIIGWSKYPGRT